MKDLPLPPCLQKDITDAVMANVADTEPHFTYSHLWPFTLTTSTTKYGSKTFTLEFRIMRKFSFHIGFFWKSENAT